MNTLLAFADMSKAFDKVPHSGLLLKLKHIGIDGYLLKWCEAYLTDRFQKVVVGGLWVACRSIFRVSKARDEKRRKKL